MTSTAGRAAAGPERVLVGLEHRTTYAFDRPVVLGPHTVRLRPAPHTRTPIESYELTVTGDPAGPTPDLRWHQDPFGNHVARAVFPEPVHELTVAVSLTADLAPVNPFDFLIEPYAETFPFTYPPALADDLEPYLRPVDGGPELAAWRSAAVPEGGSPATVQFLADLVRAVAGDVAYTVRLEPGVQDPGATLRLARGSCRDSAWLLVAVLRDLGLAARFASGYLVQLAPDDPAADTADLHAWAETYVPGAGWIGLDATSGLFAGEGHIPLSATPHPSDAAPISGTSDIANARLGFEHVVRRLGGPPGGEPYPPERWAAITALGETVDARLDADDVRLTMGGEPTFVAADGAGQLQWTVAADGPDKRRLAAELARRLAAHYAPTGVVHHGQGKWYPGEPLPRWQKAITWRRDGTPLWPDPALLADPDDEPTGADAAERARALIEAIAAGLGIDPAFVLPAYEDRLRQVADEARLPAGLPPGHDPDRPLAADARIGLVAELDTDAGDSTGWVLPVHTALDGDGWATTRWRLRRGRLVLVPGSSPLGLRLPLDSIAWTPPPGVPERSPYDPAADFTRTTTATITPVEDAPTTALAVEARDGHVCVFLPPLPRFAEAADLLAVVADAAVLTGTPVVLEGYPLPRDAATHTLTVTPDPGVVEVNVHPAASWDELVEITTTLADTARTVGLEAETYGIDGDRRATGGGSHLTLGGRTPADSPLLRRPDLLVSLLTYWQHHPALSYLFAGRFVGPTSQSPRVDEARHEYLYELEIAFGELDRLRVEDRVFPWTVDRALRHLLTDLTGNTHRAEFCIDKLYNPGSATGRLGLLELRGFEMPPHPQLSLVQALLVRALVARLWREPCRGSLVRWGTRLHDRFVLPAFVAADVADVADDLQAHGLAFEAEWLTPFLDFRFPLLGRVSAGTVRAELRAAIEPWHVLGEEASGGGTARYVDSSLERVQVSLHGATEGRHVLTCNDVVVPLQPLRGELVAGVRFRATLPPSSLHPTIAVQAPLRFALLDTWTDRMLAGFAHHVAPPDGSTYDGWPADAAEADRRRAARFVPAPGRALTAAERAAAVPRPDAEYPVTLDLRAHR